MAKVGNKTILFHELSNEIEKNYWRQYFWTFRCGRKTLLGHFSPIGSIRDFFKPQTQHKMASDFAANLSHLEQ